ncbi:MAG: hypothetical protein ACPGWS_02470 [Solirubrobacterales bacterium]
MQNLISKLIAAAISAAVVLLWWPIIMSVDGPSSWALRAVAWTLLFEVVHALLVPIEQTIWDNVKSARSFATRLFKIRSRVYADEASPLRRVLSHAAVVLLVATVPVGLIVNGPAPKKQEPIVVHERPNTKIIRETKVVYLDAGTTTDPIDDERNGKPQERTAERPKRQSPTKAPKQTPDPAKQPGASSPTGAVPDAAPAPATDG